MLVNLKLIIEVRIFEKVVIVNRELRGDGGY